LTPAEITAESDRLMAATAERVRLRDLLQQSLAERLTPAQRRAVQDQCRELTVLNRKARARLRLLDEKWERLVPGARDAA